MDSWEWNKIAGAVLGAVLFILVINLLAQHLFDNPPPKKPGYSVALPEGATSQAAATSEAMPDFVTAMGTADPAHGQAVAERCLQCHAIAKDAGDRIGPNLWGLIGRARASQPGYAYSAAMSANHDPWTDENFFTYLKAPMAVVPNSKMSFIGISSRQDRIDLIAYLHSQADPPAETK